MFTTCIHCTQSLGANQAFEAFPVGSRLAFDPAKGRLWVVCRSCDRWNLSPLDERWEAIEAMERRYRDSRLRVSTDNVGLARLKEGVDLIRIGEPQRPEMAAWRYGDQFGKRRKRQLLVTGTVVGSVAAIIGGMAAVGVSVGSFAGVYANAGIWDALVHGRPSTSIGKIALPDGEVVDVQRKHARMTALERSWEGGPVRMRLEAVQGTYLLEGTDALKAATRLLPTVNRFGGTKAQVQEAVSLLEVAGDPAGVWAMVQQQHGWSAGDKRWSGSSWSDNRKRVQKFPGTLHTLAPRDRLALEMALHEETERRAMLGELSELQRAWAEAEEIAKIADGMFVSSSITEQLERLKKP